MKDNDTVIYRGYKLHFWGGSFDVYDKNCDYIIKCFRYLEDAKAYIDKMEENKMIKTYIKKPLPVQAVYLKEDSVDEIIKLLDSCVTEYEPLIDMKDKSKIVGFLIHSWEGAEPQLLGDDYYIIRGIKGEAYPCEGNVFRDSYEEKK